jgi:hypothetical protein
MKTHAILELAVVTALLVSCSSAGGSSDDWSRTYFASQETVIDAAIDVLETEGYLVDVDREKGRISAEPSRGSTGNLVSLVVLIKRKNDRIRVAVQTRPGAAYSGVPSKSVEAPVLEFFHELDLRLMRGLD